MNKDEICIELKLPYHELQSYLLKKYGAATCSYFSSPTSKSKNRDVFRTKEGLYCHHMDEDKAYLLSDYDSAKHYPFEWQTKDHLVYCNILEHLLLHIKISILQHTFPLSTVNSIMGLSTPGIMLLCSEINDMFIKNGTSVPWRQRCFEEIRDNYYDYIAILQAFLKFIDHNYNGCKNHPPFLIPGATFQIRKGICEVLEVSNNKKNLLIKLPSGSEKRISSSKLFCEFSFEDATNFLACDFSSGFSSSYKSNEASPFYQSIYNDLVAKKAIYDRTIDEYASALQVDCNRQVHLQYNINALW